jgi:hypothetical protein
MCARKKRPPRPELIKNKFGNGSSRLAAIINIESDPRSFYILINGNEDVLQQNDN